MRVFIANFGQGNYLWPDCYRKSTVATIDGVDVHPFWEARDRTGYIDYAIANLKTTHGKPPTRPVASRWFGLTDVIAETSGDIWFHREKDQLWWTTSRADPVKITLENSGRGELAKATVYELHKQCDPWSNRSRHGAPLSWSALHAKAKHFLFTEGTLQQLSPQNALYALALIDGDDLDSWHNSPVWRAAAAKARRDAGTTYDRLGVTAYRMVQTALATVAGANGQEATRTIKEKFSGFQNLMDFEVYVRDLFKEQDGCCAISSIPLQLDGDDDDHELRCSLDRIDSSGHYEPGNLQIVCKFINRWKSASVDAEFRRLLQVVRSTQI